ncbi:MAG TPA: hypothetical protein IAC31_08025 [Candidatus Faecousia intestinigallinarum]|nr:hypothetical protein [Candidatus Faecousia intestinigallinarum]
MEAKNNFLERPSRFIAKEKNRRRINPLYLQTIAGMETKRSEEGRKKEIRI